MTIVNISKKILNEVRDPVLMAQWQRRFRVGLVGQKNEIICKIEWMEGDYITGCAFTPYISQDIIAIAMQKLHAADFQIVGFIKMAGVRANALEENELYWNTVGNHGIAARSYPSLLFIVTVPDRHYDFYISRGDEKVLYQLCDD